MKKDVVRLYNSMNTNYDYMVLPQNVRLVVEKLRLLINKRNTFEHRLCGYRKMPYR